MAPSGEFPQPINVFLRVDTGQVTTEDLTLVLGGVPDKSVGDDTVTHGAAASPPYNIDQSTHQSSLLYSTATRFISNLTL